MFCFQEAFYSKYRKVLMYLFAVILFILIPVLVVFFWYQSKFGYHKVIGEMPDRFPIVVEVSSGTEQHNGIMYYNDVQLLLTSGYQINYVISSGVVLEQLYIIYQTGFNLSAKKLFYQEFTLDNGFYNVEGDWDDDIVLRSLYGVFDNQIIPYGYQYMRSQSYIAWFFSLIFLYLLYFLLIFNLFGYKSPERKKIGKSCLKLIGFSLILVFVYVNLRGIFLVYFG